MLQGTVDWPAETAARYRAAGLWDGSTLFGLLRGSAARWPDKAALVAGDRRLSYAELQQQATRLAARLLRLGLAPRDRVVMQLPNILEFAVVYFALARIGAIPVMALRPHRHAEIRHFLNASGARAYVIAERIGDFDYRNMVEQLRAEAPALRHVIVVGDALPGQQAYADLVREGPFEPPEVPVDPAEVGTMLLSGGTTSMSKLIPRTHQDYVLNARLCGRAAGFDEGTVFMAILPLGHNYNLASPGMLATLLYGGTVVLAPSTQTDEIFATVQRERVTHIAAVVPLIATWLASDVETRYDLRSLRVVQNGGARLAPELRARLRERFGCTPQEIYGTAEGLINMTRLDDADEPLLNSSGAPVCDEDEIRVLDEQDRDVAEGESGELVTRGPYTIRGYYDAADKNAEAFTADGFYRMGDIVRKRGRHVYAEGRRKDFINRGGEKISCEEIENLMFAHPKVKSATLVAMPDAVFGEKACAFVVPHPGQSLSFDELIAFLLRQQIASFKLPERLEIVDELPVSPVGKILKRQLREAIALKLQQEQHP
ncbi:MAG: 2,3-dihydroxybenzoate-AMP ligase [Proteobacteria bacterium]|nr:2,3-dihydroxybenzoate-AMP ligase [Pseudomonadota bacterium]